MKALRRRLQDAAKLARVSQIVVERDYSQSYVVRAQFPWQRQPMVPVKLEVTHDEPVLLPSDRQTVHHGYGEAIDARVRAYCLEEIGAEKLRSTQQTLAKLTARGWTRPRARDYYDLWHLVREPDDRLSWERVSAVLPEKCRVRDVSLASVDQVFEDRLIDDVRATWERSVGPFVPRLPDVDTVLAELRERLSVLLRL